jgi:hypothetical protein
MSHANQVKFNAALAAIHTVVAVGYAKKFLKQINDAS